MFVMFAAPLTNYSCCVCSGFEGGIAFDKGCEHPVPFGAVTLDMLLRNAEQLGTFH